jgi:hypothetical protein
MRSSFITPFGAGLALVGLVALCSPAPAATVTIGGDRLSEAMNPTFRGAPSNPGGRREQTSYDASFFGTAPLRITGMAFSRTPCVVFCPPANQTLTTSFSDFEIRLSTTMRGDERGTPLSIAFADNVGADAVLTRDGALTITDRLADGPFSLFIPFTTAFLYDPTRGNLLLDTTIPTGATGAFGALAVLNRFNDGVFSLLSNASATALRGGPDNTGGHVVRFFVEPVNGGGGAVAVPLPSALLLLGVGIAGLVVARRRPAA